MKNLRGRTVLLTGASTGIGPHIATRLHDEGASLVLSARHADALERVALELDPARVVVADLTRRNEVERLADAAGEIDVLVANAGIPASGELVSFSVDQIDRAIDHVTQRSLYFRDPDGLPLEIYFEMPDALTVFREGRGDQDAPLPLSKPGEPLPDWLLDDEWPRSSDVANGSPRRHERS